MEANIKIHVRRRHIVKGKAESTEECPIALAVAEVTGEQVAIDFGTAYMQSKDVALPSIALRFIKRFDAGRPVKPFAFVLK